jgi:A/G-specific adenine glycosylase
MTGHDHTLGIGLEILAVQGTMKRSGQKTLDNTKSQFSRYDSTSSGILAFQQMVLSYYEQHGRDMAWRSTTDPYQILVSEIMLQQTQVERVTTKFPEFIHAFPDFESLATAPLANVLTVWQGMGYNRRAISLQKCALRVVHEYNGVLPADVDLLSTFPGIGSATASSIAAFAFNMPVVFIETNIRRVFIHFFFSATATVNDAEILPLVKKAVYPNNPRVWYWALMDLGSALKKTVPNPNRQSIHYTKQSPFEGSDRKIRGAIIRMLLAEPGIRENTLLNIWRDDPARIKKILSALEYEGFILRNNDRFFLSGGPGFS